MASTTLHRNPPFRAEHLGSLLRPKNLLDKRAEVHDGKAKAEELKPLEDEAIKDIVDKQQQWGYRALSDGEYRYAAVHHPLAQNSSTSRRNRVY